MMGDSAKVEITREHHQSPVDAELRQQSVNGPYLNAVTPTLVSEGSRCHMIGDRWRDHINGSKPFDYL